MSTFVVVHGPSLATEKGLIEGRHTDADLSLDSIALALEIGRQAKAADVALMVSSSLRRGRETALYARQAAGLLGSRYMETDELDDYCFGSLEEIPESLIGLSSYPLTNTPGAEGVWRFAERTVRGLQADKQYWSTRIDASADNNTLYILHPNASRMIDVIDTMRHPAMFNETEPFPVGELREVDIPDLASKFEWLEQVHGA